MNDDINNITDDLWNVCLKTVTKHLPYDTCELLRNNIAIAIRQAVMLGDLEGYRRGNREAHKAMALAVQQANENNEKSAFVKSPHQ